MEKIGYAEIDQSDGTTSLYGVYEVSEAGDRLRVRREATYGVGGEITEVFHEDMPMMWGPAKWFSRVGLRESV